MCHTTALETAQIERCVNGGMPERIGKSLQYSLRKRQAREERRIEQKNEMSDQKSTVEIQKVEEMMQEQQPETSISISNGNGNKILDSVPQSNDIKNQKAIGNVDQSFTIRCPVTNTIAVASSLYAPSAISHIEKKQNQTDFLYGSLLPFPKKGQSENLYISALVGKNASDAGTRSVENLKANLHKTEVESKIFSEFNCRDVMNHVLKWIMLLLSYIQQHNPLRDSKLYILLTKTTQPAHIVAVGLSFFVLLTVWPEFHFHQSKSNENRKKLWPFCIYLAAFATHFGSQIWMTFVSGLSLFFSLPRHLFGRCQQILFPKYFALNAALSILMLIFYVKYVNGNWKVTEWLQFLMIMITGIIEVIIRLYLTPPLLRNMLEKYRIEDVAGMGSEVGANIAMNGIILTDLIKCPHYQQVHKRFRRLHMIVATGNIATLVTSCVHLYYLAALIHIAI